MKNTGNFKIVLPQAKEIEIDNGWFSVSWRWFPDKKTRRGAHGKWYRITNPANGRNIFRVIKFSPTLDGTHAKDDASWEMVLDWQAFLKLTDYSDTADLKDAMDLSIHKARWWQMPMLAMGHPDPGYRLASLLGLLSFGISVVSLLLAIGVA